MFSKFAKWIAEILGQSYIFVLAVVIVVIWLLAGPFFNFSENWQLIINTATTIITFLMVFILQNTQNRDTLALHLKLDEIIRAMSHTHNELLKIEELPDEELQKLIKRYENLASEVKSHMKKGESDTGSPEIKKEDIEK